MDRTIQPWRAPSINTPARSGLNPNRTTEPQKSRCLRHRPVSHSERNLRMKPFQQTFMTRGYYDQYFDEDFVEGAVASMRLSIRRIQWRRSSGHWPSELIGANRTKMEAEIEQLVKA